VDIRNWDRVCEETEDAHRALLKSLHHLEDAVLAKGMHPAEWRDGVARALSGLIDLLRKHREAAAASTGLVGMAESIQGRSASVTALSQSHDALRDDAQSLFAELRSVSNPEVAHSPFRRDAARLASAVRAHEAVESALIYETNVRVSGGEG